MPSPEHNPAERARRLRTQRLSLIALVLVILGAIIAVGVWYSSGGTHPAKSASLALARGDHSLLVGKNDAKVKVVVYEDFQCPYCRDFEYASRDFLHSYAAKGVVQVEYRPFPLLAQMPYSLRGLNAFIAVLQHGSPKAALALHDKLYDEQPDETASATVSQETIKGWVQDAAGDKAGVLDALASPDVAWFRAALKAAIDAGVKGTPTVLVDGKQFGADQDMTGLADNLEQYLADRA